MTCECGRPKYTEGDLQRWRKEFPAGVPIKDPEWSRALCWTVRGVKCHMKPVGEL